MGDPTAERMAWTVTVLAGMVVFVQVTVAWADARDASCAFGPCFSTQENLQLMGAWPLVFAGLFLGCLLTALALHFAPERAPADG